MLISHVFLGVTTTYNILGIYCVLHSTVPIMSAQVPPSGAKRRTKLCRDKDQVLIFCGPATVIIGHIFLMLSHRDGSRERG